MLVNTPERCPAPPPAPPDVLSNRLVEELDDLPPDDLREVAAYADTLATFCEETDRTADGEDDEPDTEPTSENRPTDVPSKAMITVKEINGNRYNYWQWRDGEQIKSKYKGPAEE